MWSLKQLRTLRRGRVSVAKETRRQLRLQKNLQRLYFKRLNTLFRKFVNVRAGLYKEYGIYDQLVSQRALQEELEPTTLAHYKRIFRTVINNNNEVIDRGTKDVEAIVLGRSVDFERVVNEYFQTRSLILAGISARLARRIEVLIQRGRAENLTLPQIAKSISDNMLPISRSRAALIARTETHNAASFANHTYYTEAKNALGITMVKRWVSTGDTRTRSSHASANGQTVPMDEKFIVGGVPMEYAGDPAGGASNTVNCRCVIVYADENDMLQ